MRQNTKWLSAIDENIDFLNLSIDRIIFKCLDLIFQYNKNPKLAGVQIDFHNKIYKSNTFKKTKYFLNEDFLQLIDPNGCIYFYYKSFERRVWYYGEIGKTHLPDLPRGDNLEYDPFWNHEYGERVAESGEEIRQMERAMEIIRNNRTAGIKNSSDLEVFASMVQLVEHTCHTYLALSELELAIREAHRQHFRSHEKALEALEHAVRIIEDNLREREKVYTDLVAVWEKTRLPKGMSTADKEFFHRQDRARHFAFRRADMTYLIYDEELLGLEDYKEKLLEYIAYYRSLYFQQESLAGNAG